MKTDMSIKDTVVLFKGRSYNDNDAQAQLRVPLIPLSLISLAAPLKEAGYKVEIIDQAALEGNNFEFGSYVWGKVLCVGISALTGREIAEGIAFAKLVKEDFPHIPVVWGGWHVSILPEESMAHDCVDFVVKGLGQKSLLELVDCFSRGKKNADIAGVYCKSNGVIVHAPGNHFSGLDRCPLPAFDMLNLEYYRKHSLFLRHKPIINGMEITGHLYYVSSFGCPNECAYCCSNRMFGKRMYKYDIEKVVEQIEWLVKEKKFNSISFMDANFFVDMERIKRFCLLIKKSRLSFVWDAQMCVRDIIRYEREKVLGLVKESGCYRVNIGAESGAQETLNYIRKNIKVDDILESARIITRHGIEAAYNFLFGLPEVEKRKYIYESFSLMVKLKKINPEFVLPVSFYVPFPGTSMYKDAVQRGWRPPDSLDIWGSFDSNYDCASKTYPWKSARLERLIYDAATFYVPLAIPGNMYRGTLRRIKAKMKSSKVKVFIKIGHYLAYLRVRYSFYHFPFEKVIFKIYRFLRNVPVYLPGGKSGE